MKSINISLPDSLRSYVEEQVRIGGYSTIGEDFHKLIRCYQKHKATERLEALLLEGLNSGVATPMTEQDWEEIRTAVREKVAKSTGSSQR